jgi:hypothetical protein
MKPNTIIILHLALFLFTFSHTFPITGLFYFQDYSLSEIPSYIQTFDQTIILSKDEGVTFNITALSLVVNAFHQVQPGYKLFTELGYPKGSLTQSQLMDRLQTMEQALGDKIHGYYFTPEGCLYMYNNTASDGTLTRDNIKSVVDYIHSNLKKTCYWIPIEAAGGVLESYSFFWIFLAQDYIGFDYVTPQPHYMEINQSGDVLRPIGMNFIELVEFMRMSSKLGLGVQFEANQGVVGEKSDCGCVQKDLCMRRCANYWCAYQSAGVNIPVSYYFSTSIVYEQAVVDFLSKNPCPPTGFPVC